MASKSARRRRGDLRLLGSGEGLRSQAQVCFSERFLLLADPGTGPCARGRMCCEACTRALRDNFAMHAPLR